MDVRVLTDREQNAVHLSGVRLPLKLSTRRNQSDKSLAGQARVPRFPVGASWESRESAILPSANAQESVPVRLAFHAETHRGFNGAALT